MEDGLISTVLLGGTGSPPPRGLFETSVVPLVVPSDFRGIVSDGRNIGDFYVVSDVQMYLDLLGAGQRADEQAEELRKAKDFSGGWK